MNIAIIPARIGSKRIAKKNIKPFCGIPIINYPIKIALESNLFDRVIVSTDSKEIANIAIEAGAEVPFFRPNELSDDYTVTADVILHSLNKLNINNNIDYACCIYATAVFVNKVYLEQGYKIITEKKSSTAFSITTFPFSIFRSLKINDNGNIEMIWPEHMNTRSNDLEEAYHDAGQFYWINVKKFLNNPSLYANDSMPIIIPRSHAQDIDTLEDWKKAELMYKAIQLSE